MGKSTISMAMFNSKLLVYQRVIALSNLNQPFWGPPILGNPQIEKWKYMKMDLSAVCTKHCDKLNNKPNPFQDFLLFNGFTKCFSEMPSVIFKDLPPPLVLKMIWRPKVPAVELLSAKGPTSTEKIILGRLHFRERSAVTAVFVKTIGIQPVFVDEQVISGALKGRIPLHIHYNHALLESYAAYAYYIHIYPVRGKLSMAMTVGTFYERPSDLSSGFGGFRSPPRDSPQKRSLSLGWTDEEYLGWFHTWSRSLPTVIVGSGAHNQPWWNFNGIFVGAKSSTEISGVN